MYDELRRPDIAGGDDEGGEERFLRMIRDMPEVLGSDLDALVGRHFPGLIARIESGKHAGPWQEVLHAQSGEQPWLCLLAGMYPLPDSGPRDIAALLLRAEVGFRERGEALGELRTLLAMARRCFFGETFYPGPLELRHRIGALLNLVDVALVDRLHAALVEGQFGILVAFDDRLVRAAVAPLLATGIPPEFASLRAELVATLAHAECMTGQHARGLEVLEQAHDLLANPGVSAWSRFYLRMAHANACGLMGRGAAFEHDRAAIMCMSPALLQRTLAGPFLAIWSLNFLILQGLARDAAEMAEAQLLSPALGYLPALRGEFLHYLAYARALAGDTVAARDAVAAARSAQQECGNSFFQLVDDLITGAAEILCGRHVEGCASLERVLHQNVLHEEVALREGALWLRALSTLRQTGPESALPDLREALRINRARQGHVFAWSRCWTPELLGLAVAREVDAEQARNVAAAAFGCGIEDDGSVIPFLEMGLVGGFSLRVRDREPCGMEDVPPVLRRLLQLLSVQPGLAMTVQETLARMWPGVSPDSARASLDAALLRLRRLFASRFGPARYVILAHGVLALRHVRVDAVMLVERIEYAQGLSSRMRPWQAEGALAEGLALARGAFVVPDLDDMDARLAELTLVNMLEKGAVLWERLLRGQKRDEEVVDALIRMHAVLPHHPGLTQRLGCLLEAFAENTVALRALAHVRLAHAHAMRCREHAGCLASGTS